MSSSSHGYTLDRPRRRVERDTRTLEERRIAREKFLAAARAEHEADPESAEKASAYALARRAHAAGATVEEIIAREQRAIDLAVTSRTPSDAVDAFMREFGLARETAQGYFARALSDRRLPVEVHREIACMRLYALAHEARVADPPDFRTASWALVQAAKFAGVADRVDVKVSRVEPDSTTEIPRLYAEIMGRQGGFAWLDTMHGAILREEELVRWLEEHPAPDADTTTQPIRALPERTA